MATPTKPTEAAPEVKDAAPKTETPKPAIKTVADVAKLKGGMKVKVHEKMSSVPKEDLEQVLVWYGTKRDAPFVNFGIGGICFAAHVNEIKAGAHGSPDSHNSHDGNYHKMTRVRIKEVMEAVSKTAFRFGSRVEVWDVTHPDYVQDVQDKPVGKFLYMVAVSEGEPFNRTADSAPSMVD